MCSIAPHDPAAPHSTHVEPVERSRLGYAYLDANRGQDAYRRFLVVRRLHPGNWGATLGLAVLHAQAQEGGPARELLAEALRQGEPAAHETAARFPVLEPFRVP